MNRFYLNVYIGDQSIFDMEFRSLTSVAKCIDRFSNCEKYKISFELYDCVKGRYVNTNELMRIWHM